MMSRSWIFRFCFSLGIASAAYYSFATPSDGHQVPDPASVKSPMEAAPAFSSSAHPVHSPLNQIRSTIAPFLPAPLASLVAPDAPPSAIPAPDANPDATVDPNAIPMEADLASQGWNGAFPMIPSAPSSMGHHQPASASVDPAAASPTSADLPLLPNQLPGSNSHTGHSSSGGLVSGGNANAGLKKEDYEALLSSWKGSFQEGMLNSTGQLCNSADQSCSTQSKSVHALRWGTEEGLNRQVNFAIQSIGPTLQFNVDFKIQKSLTNEESVSLHLNPVNIDVRNESIAGKELRVMEFRFPDFSVRGESMTRVKAKMVFESTASGWLPTAESRFEFSRSKVSVSLAMWDLTPVVVTTPSGGIAGSWMDPGQLVPQWGDDESDRKPSSADSFYWIADELVYSIKVEKS
jgi:hypothetical protein